MNFKTPGVYLQELSLLPANISQVETAIPAFIGYTQKVLDNDNNEITTFPYIKRIKSLKDFEQFFGKTFPQPIEVNFKNNEVEDLKITASKYKLYYALQLFYSNGGGPCYIVSIGKQTKTETIAETDFTGADKALDALKKKDEPTLLLAPDSVSLSSIDYFKIATAMLNQSNDLQDRFTILDIYDTVDDFRTNIGTNNLNYGAAYYPNLKTGMNYHYNDGSVTLKVIFSDNPNTDIQKLKDKNLADIKAVIRTYEFKKTVDENKFCLLYTSPSPRDATLSRMPSSA